MFVPYKVSVKVEYIEVEDPFTEPEDDAKTFSKEYSFTKNQLNMEVSITNNETMSGNDEFITKKFSVEVEQYIPQATFVAEETNKVENIVEEAQKSAAKKMLIIKDDDAPQEAVAEANA